MASIKELQDISNVLRRDSISMTTSAGSGHPSSCMSCAEIMSVLYFDEMKYDVKNSQNPDNDEFILSKGHCAPILYSCLFRSGMIHTNLNSLRKFGSPLEGHPVPASLDSVKVATGSLGQGLSVGVGMALAAKLQKRHFRVYVLMGDSEIAEGSVYEALQLAHYYKLNNLVAIVDVNRLGQRGETMHGHDIRAYQKRFSGFGWNVFVINGHSVSEVQRAFLRARKSKGPVMILAKTMKGKGVSFIENKQGWHGKALSTEETKLAFSEIPSVVMPKIAIHKPLRTQVSKILKKKVSVTSYKKDDVVATRQAYGAMLANLAESDSSVLALDAETSNSTFAAEVKKKNPQQFIETFIAEQNLVGVSLGLSKKGFHTFSSTFAAFFSRAHDHIRMASLSSADMTFCGSHSGVSIGEDGSSQMGLGDISMFRNIFGSSVFHPSDAISCEKIIHAAKSLRGVTYIRTSRPKTQILYSSKESFPPGEFKILKKSSKDKVVICGSGVTVHEALKAYNLLQKEGINASVVDLYSIKPFNHAKFSSFVKNHGSKFVVSEDHYPEGGIYEMVTSGVSGFESISLSVIKMPRSGTKDELLSYEGIDAASIVKAVKKLI